MRDAVLAAVLERLRCFRTTGDATALHDDGADDALGRLRTLLADADGRDPDALWLLVEFHRARAEAEPDRYGEDFRRALDIAAPLFLLNPFAVPRELWPELTALTGHDPLADPLDRAADLVIDGKRRGDATVLTEAVALLRTADATGRQDYRDLVLGQALTHLAASPGRQDAERLADATEAVLLLDALTRAPDPGTGRWLTYCHALTCRFDLAKDPADLTAAENAYRQVLALAEEGGDQHTLALAGIGTVHGRRAEVAPDPGHEVREAVRWLRRAVDQAPGDGGAHRVNLRRATGLLVQHTVRAARASAAPADTALAGPGPAEDPAARRPTEEFLDIAARLGARILTHAQAVELVTDPAREPGPETVAAVLASAARALPTGPEQRLLPALTLAMAVAGPRWGTARGGLWWSAADLYVEAARRSLVHTPNGAVLRRARALLDRQIATLRPDQDPAAADELAETLFVTGLLHLTPYAGHMAGLSFAGAHHLWLRREARLQAVGPHDEPAGDPSAAPVHVTMPDPAESVTEAVGHLREAAGIATGHLRGRVLKALAEALSFLAGLTEGPGHDREILTAARAALDLLHPARDPLAFLYVLRILTLSGELALPSDVTDLLPVPLTDLPPHEGLSVCTETLDLLDEAGRPDLTYQLLRLAERQLPPPTDPAQQRRWWGSAVHVLPGDRLRCGPGLDDVRRALGHLRPVMADGDWPPSRRAAALVHLAAHAHGPGTEDLGRELLAEARRTAPEWAGSREVHHPLTYLDARLAHGAALRIEDTDPGAAAQRHAAAATANAACGQIDSALADLEAVVHCAERCADEEARTAALAMVPAAVLLGGGRDEGEAWALRDLWQRTLLAVTGGTVSPGVLLILHQVAKSLALTGVLAAAGPFDPPPWLAARLDRPRAADEADDPPPDAELPGNVEGMLFYVAEGEAEPDGTEGAEQRNHQRAVDRWLSAGLHAARGPAALPVLPDEIQARIDPDTVLVSLFLGHMPRPTDGRPCMALRVLAVTREDMWHGSTRIPDLDGGLLRMTRGAHQLAVSPIALPVSRLRRGVTADPLHRAVSRDGAQRLTQDAETFLGPLADLLPTWQAHGKRHLCVWPNGPLHYVPHHLLSPNGRALADDWTVTHLPSLGILAPRPPTPATGRTVGGLVAFAAARGPEDAGLEEHAARVAEPFGGAAVTGPAATPRRFLADIPGARYVHVAAHGRHNEWASWYQCLHLTPEGDDDGRVFAHDILRADLRGVELVTLSSCESALGRFDVNDNLKGLPAAFLAAGASAVIGCLWPVHPEVSTHFFATLYRELGASPDRRAAYRAAQLATRARFPAHRDWGAFCFVGDWRTPPGPDDARPEHQETPL
ncbi:CHAT domain-containing protein [Streptomyces avicenniae]|uniref:CHAT domain-containing protein n=1 Tax=Streptomyces avicenniae TaxID=500153 RepID=UPI00069AF885|nr:CHAT domain-containing protein [Streptomyces avicenniae]